ncbi:hypothetical protein RUM43_007022 [Polyplax serrata]|uniref:Uncharacterized protein n=1 Tax=Polyplax serrata TaxID=468196 RepID=A0AAN8P1A8_POLSC
MNGKPNPECGLVLSGGRENLFTIDRWKVRKGLEAKEASGQLTPIGGISIALHATSVQVIHFFVGEITEDQRGRRQQITSPDHKSIRNPVLDLYVLKTLRCHPPREGSFWKKTRNDEDYRAVDLNRCQLDYKVINFNAAEIGSAGVPGWYPRRDA